MLWDQHNNLEFTQELHMHKIKATGSVIIIIIILVYKRASTCNNRHSPPFLSSDRVRKRLNKFMINLVKIKIIK